MNERRRQMIHTILDGREELRLKEFQDLFLVSERTLRYDLEHVASWLEDYGLELVHQTGQGVWKLAEVPEAPVMKRIFQALNADGRAVSGKERYLLIIHELVMHEKWLTLRDIADEIEVSKATVLQHMDDVEQWLGMFKLTLERGNRGFGIHGSERNKRLALLSVMDALESVWETTNPMPFLNWGHLSIRDLDVLSEWTARWNHAETLALPSLFRLLALQLERFRAGCLLEPLESMEPVDHAGFNELWSHIGQHDLLAELAADDGEQAFAWAYLRAIEGLTSLQPDTLPADFQAFLVEMDNRIGFQAVPEQERLELLEEWEKLKWIIQADIYFTHPLAETMESQYSFLLYHAWEAVMDQMPEGHKLSVQQIIPMVIRLASIYETSSHENERYQVWVVCPRGVATSRLLTATLRKHLPQIQVKRTLAMTELSKVEEWETPDFIISTVTLPESPYPSVTVKPILTQEELQKLQNFLTNSDHLPKHRNRATLPSSVHSLILPERIAVYEGGETHTLSDIIEAGVDLLEQGGLISTAYKTSLVDSIINDEHLFEVIPGVLFPHTRSPHVKKPGFSLVQLKEPLHHHDRYSQAVLFMVTPDDKAHLPQLQYLHQLLMEPQQAEKIRDWSLLHESGTRRST
ncbi:transcription antiterminator [Thalassobacillus sp. CUG 92003]|uniref:BglG family transcription antiterminator n=1 Tax=Thalassobacillus sp. CUG 92003 TaxID=2736641 RepID=UPI0015E65AE3|nr:PTS sugar transporter subunit IIA [Thalassobacillus sp. CUG 92003]